MTPWQFYARRPHHDLCAIVDGYNACTCTLWHTMPTPAQVAYDREQIGLAHVAALEFADMELTRLLGIQPRWSWTTA